MEKIKYIAAVSLLTPGNVIRTLMEMSIETFV